MTCESKQNRIEQFERVCRDRGLPVTTQRRTIFEMILDRDLRFSPADLQF